MVGVISHDFRSCVPLRMRKWWPAVFKACFYFLVPFLMLSLNQDDPIRNGGVSMCVFGVLFHFYFPILNGYGSDRNRNGLEIGQVPKRSTRSDGLAH